jgi:tetratricopeptide (TPR) repeat protein
VEGIRHLRRSTEILDELLAADATNTERRMDMARTRTELGRALLASGEAAPAAREIRTALAALAIPDPAAAEDERRSAAEAEARALLGDALAAAGRRDEARAEWEAAAAALAPLATDSRDPRILAPLAHSLVRLDRGRDASAPLGRLRGAGFRRWDMAAVMERRPPRG